MVMEDKHYFRLGEIVNKLAQAYIPASEKGRMFEGYYLTLQKEAERDARDKANGKHGD
jgi:hypothetical protein